MKIEALHDFHSAKFSREWADKFTPTSVRIDLFNTIKSLISKNFPPSVHILELGIGPGFLAQYLLSHFDLHTYDGIDFSDAMLSIDSERNHKYHNRITYTKGDLTSEEWPKSVSRKPDVIVSTWALHDLIDIGNISDVYKRSFELLPDGGMFINGDFIKPEESLVEYEGGRIKPSQHLTILKETGFSSVECIKLFEENIENPTTSNNYACFKAEKNRSDNK